jgi:hypothetical protein
MASAPTNNAVGIRATATDEPVVAPVEPPFPPVVVPVSIV